MTDADERARVAFHEAGHNVAGFLLFGPGSIVGPASIVESLRWRGVAHVRAPGVSTEELDRIDPGKPSVLYPEFFRSCAVDAIVSLAGSAAEQYRPRVLPPGNCYIPEPKPLDDDEEQAALILAPLSEKDARLLALGDDAEAGEIETDMEQAFAAAEAISEPGPSALALLHWLHEETRVFVASYLFQRRLKPLADALLERGTLGEEALLALLKNPKPVEA